MKRTVLLFAVCAASCQSRPIESALAQSSEVPVRERAATPSHESIGRSPRKTLALGFAPNDMTTNTGSSISVWLDGDGGSIDAKSIERVRSSVSLRTYPELEAVPFSLSTRTIPIYRGPVEVAKGTVDRSPPPEPHQGRVYIDIVPGAALASRWYVVAVGNVPAEAMTEQKSVHADVKLGGAYARFNPKSAPALDRISICKKANSARVVAQFTEPVTLDTVSAKLIEVTGAAGEKCTVQIPQSYGTALPGQNRFYLDCPASLWAAPQMTVTLRQGVKSAASALEVGLLDDKAGSAANLVRLGEQSRALDFAAAKESGSCRELSAL